MQSHICAQSAEVEKYYYTYPHRVQKSKNTVSILLSIRFMNQLLSFIIMDQLLTHIHKQCESMEWQKHWVGWVCTELLAPTIFHTLKHWYQYTYLGL